MVIYKFVEEGRSTPLLVLVANKVQRSTLLKCTAYRISEIRGQGGKSQEKARRETAFNLTKY
jgi:hypothetical protein